MRSPEKRPRKNGVTQRGVNVYPVKGAPDEQLHYEALPHWMREAHFYDVGQWTGENWTNVKEWETFVKHLKSDRQPPRIPFLAPDLPGDFVPRVKEFEELVSLVRAQGPTQPTMISRGRRAVSTLVIWDHAEHPLTRLGVGTGSCCRCSETVDRTGADEAAPRSSRLTPYRRQQQF